MSFNHVKLNSHALLGPFGSRLEDRAQIRRLGRLALGASVIPAMEQSAYIAGRDSQRRTVGVQNVPCIPILSFRTQHAPILITLAQTFVAKEFLKVALANFTNASVDLRVKQAWATVLKATQVDHAKTVTLVLSSRRGAQGLFSRNEICSQHDSPSQRATFLVYIFVFQRFLTLLMVASELLQERYHVPKSTHPSSLLARHEQGLFAENQQILHQSGGHRSADFNNLVLPKSELIVRAIGHRMAYDATLDANLDNSVTDLYLTSAMALDPAWYAEHAGFGGAQQDVAMHKAVTAALPFLDEWLKYELRLGNMETLHIPNARFPLPKSPLNTKSTVKKYEVGLRLVPVRIKKASSTAIQIELYCKSTGRESRIVARAWIMMSWQVMLESQARLYDVCR
ncbi:hypothetical protein B0H14DRAFT_3127223 [Mycena olivaceomarginata]|nr:hypothetical protein B0H14DRAFT_3127223 [Mycena olivaceomarginata]